MLRQQAWFVPLRVHAPLSNACKAFVRACQSKVRDQAQIDQAFEALPAASYSDLESHSAAWRELQGKLFAHEAVLWDLTALCCLPIRKQAGVQPSTFSRPSHLMPGAPADGEWICVDPIIAGRDFLLVHRAELPSIVCHVHFNALYLTLACADRHAFAVAVHVARGELRDAHDIEGMLSLVDSLGVCDLDDVTNHSGGRKRGYFRGGTEPPYTTDEVAASRFGHSFATAKAGFAVLAAIPGLHDAGELPVGFRVREAGLRLCPLPQRCDASFALRFSAVAACSTAAL